jgi:antitoxin HicB
MTKSKHHGTRVEQFLEDEGILEEATIIAVKRVVAWKLLEAMKKKMINKAQMAKMMKTSRSQLDRVLDPNDGNITLFTLLRAARLVDQKLKVELV